VFALLSALCCGGVPAYLAWPAAGQYPVSAVLPGSVADLDLRADGASQEVADRLAEEFRTAGPAVGDVFAGMYGDRNGKEVTVFGSTGFRLRPQSDVDAEMQRLSGEYDISEISAVDTGESGVHEQCGVGRSNGTSVVVCVWADHGSLATVLLTRRSVPDSADLVGLLRESVLTRG
jgi:hypothetical protein